MHTTSKHLKKVKQESTPCYWVTHAYEGILKEQKGKYFAGVRRGVRRVGLEVARIHTQMSY